MALVLELVFFLFQFFTMKWPPKIPSDIICQHLDTIQPWWVCIIEFSKDLEEHFVWHCNIMSVNSQWHAQEIVMITKQPTGVIMKFATLWDLMRNINWKIFPFFFVFLNLNYFQPFSFKQKNLIYADRVDLQTRPRVLKTTTTNLWILC